MSKLTDILDAMQQPGGCPDAEAFFQKARQMGCAFTEEDLSTQAADEAHRRRQASKQREKHIHATDPQEPRPKLLRLIFSEHFAKWLVRLTDTEARDIAGQCHTSAEFFPQPRQKLRSAIPIKQCPCCGVFSQTSTSQRELWHYCEDTRRFICESC